jgi:2-oxoglutarate ferredoxin oxidoreductase subunit beta
MLFAGGTKGIRLDLETLSLEVVDVVGGDWQAAGVIVHNVKNRAIAHMLVEMPFGPFPMALGVLYDDPRDTFEDKVIEQNAKASEGKNTSLAKLLGKGQSWTVGGTAQDPIGTRADAQGAPNADHPVGRTGEGRGVGPT